MKSQVNRPVLEGRVRDVVASGDAVVETASGVVFARGALPGEQVRVSLDDKPGRIRRGRVQAVLSASPDRVAPPCPYVERCGGCSLMHARPELQRALTRGFLEQALRKIGYAGEVRFTASEHGLGYRARARLGFRRATKTTQLGFHRERSRELVDVDRCLVLAPPLERALASLRVGLLAALEGQGELSLALGQDHKATVVLRTESAQPPALYRACEDLLAQSDVFAGLALFVGGASKPASFGDPREWSVASDGAPLEGPIGGFSQAHPGINQRLVARVVELARTEGAKVLELYAGSGNFTVALAKGAQHYTAVEQAPDAVVALRNNLTARALAVKVVAGDAEKQLGAGALDVVVLDPPRTGAPGVLLALLSRKPRRIVYVSCDPATLARDVAPLLSRGYALRWAEAFEMFPQTSELESIVLLEREA